MAQGRHIGKIVLRVDAAEAHVATPPEERSRFRGDATYLITGGLGGLGLEVAQWLANRGVRHLALMGRSAPGEAARKVLAGLAAAGVEVRVLAGDVAQESDLDAALALLDGSMPPLDGVIHAAGLLDDGILLQLDRARWRNVMAPKVDGAWNLHRRTAGRPLRHFILFSSAASLLGSPGQGNYSAANAFLDALAHHRRALGLPAVSVNWGPWTEVGLAAAQANRGERLADRGFGGISTAEGLECLRRALEAGRPQLAVMPFDLAAWRSFYPAATESPFFALWRPEDGGAGAPLAPDRGPAAVLAVPPDERRDWMEGFLKDQLGRVLGLPAARLDSGRSLSTLGLDSLMAIELKNRLESELGVSLPVVTLLRGPSIAELSAQVVGQIEESVRDTGGAVASAEGTAEPYLLERLHELPDADVDALLSSLLEEDARQQG